MSLLYKILWKKKSKALNETHFTFKEIGDTVEYLVNMAYQHKFTKAPFNSLTRDQVDFVLREKVLPLNRFFIIICLKRNKKTQRVQNKVIWMRNVNLVTMKFLCLVS